ncbi:hypothetical protein OH738_39630 [Streptomyces hirsutus]|uniref:Uncharacterized protein n=1 Tax=Streptomyces hirsutus TaxID=35620 RepID=A0ABZ1GI09_9ACTN|nr:hypothetical protein [Streptomyces hirsutus]WSD04373.1 hypothetical protein OIE73_00315 [Streptomyces hirsutus]WTD22237.1 hypothetical protein OH738_39630 [Streptomyces hirsutus]WTD72690.1 hypothetical protein OHB56_00855 [Streptomyces sp. NBC_01635]
MEGERARNEPPLFESKRLMREGERRIHSVLHLGAREVLML